MGNYKIEAGSEFPELGVPALDGSSLDVGARLEGGAWLMVVVYRGRHCPLCTKYLNQLAGHYQALQTIGVELVAVSADSATQLENHLGKLEVNFPLYHSLSIPQMQALGLYISHPRSEQETDHPFSEPGLFVINAQRRVQVVDISNNPFVRPELDALVSGLRWIRDPANNYPIRGTYP